MTKLVLSMATILLAGCASTGQWRTLSIDGGDEAAFGNSLALINDQLSSPRRDMFALALIDIAQIGVSKAEQAEDGTAYTDEDFRRQLDGLTYDDVIALADEDGLPIYQMYYYTGRRAADSSLGFAASENGPVFAADGRPLSDYRPYGERWPLGDGPDGRPVYPYD